MKKSILATALFIIALLTGCKKDEDNPQVKREQVSTAHYMALGALQSLPGNLGTLGQNQTNDNGDFIETNINLSSQWKAGQESNLSNQIAILMMKSGDLKFYGWVQINSDNLQYWGVFGYNDVSFNKSVIIVTFRLNPYIDCSMTTRYCEDGNYQKYY